MGDKKNKERSKALSSEELELWASYIKDVKPLKKNKVKKVFRPKKKILLTISSFSSPPSSFPFEAKRGKGMSPSPRYESRLDLHGFHIEAAYARLEHFLKESLFLKKRVVLVITGKGKKGREEGRETLQELVPKWFIHSPLSRYVQNHTWAQQKDGGQGAVYVYLKL